MVRDVWADGADDGRARDGVKQPEEFRTLAVITERGGGQRYIALDVTDPYADAGKGGSGTGRSAGCSPTRATRSRPAWASPGPTSRPSRRPSGRCASSRRHTPSSTARGWEERWVVMLNGGYSADLSRGRGVYMVDVWTGNKLWSARPTRAPGGSSSYKDAAEPDDARGGLAGAGGHGQGGERASATWTASSTPWSWATWAGQVWTFRFFEPGERNSSTAGREELVRRALAGDVA